MLIRIFFLKRKKNIFNYKTSLTMNRSSSTNTFPSMNDYLIVLIEQFCLLFTHTAWRKDTRIYFIIVLSLFCRDELVNDKNVSLHSVKVNNESIFA